MNTLLAHVGNRTRAARAMRLQRTYLLRLIRQFRRGYTRESVAKHRQMPAGRSEKIKAPYTRRTGNPSMLTSNEVKAASRAEATALLVPVGYRVHRPKADCYGDDLYGEDLVVRTPERRPATLPSPVPTARALDEARIGAPKPVA